MKTLHLLPNLLHPEASFPFQPPAIDALIAESEKGGWMYLKRFTIPKVPIYLLNEHTKSLSELLTIREKSVGLISDAGLPCLADPGASLVAAARLQGAQIYAYPGPSSIFLGLMLSGFSGQRFTFHGYAPKELRVGKLEKGMTHIFIEAPYRNQRFLEFLVQSLKNEDQLCIACNLTAPAEKVISQAVSEWKRHPLPSIDRQPTVFLVRI